MYLKNLSLLCEFSDQHNRKASSLVSVERCKKYLQRLFFKPRSVTLSVLGVMWYCIDPHGEILFWLFPERSKVRLRYTIVSHELAGIQHITTNNGHLRHLTFHWLQKIQWVDLLFRPLCRGDAGKIWHSVGALHYLYYSKIICWCWVS